MNVITKTLINRSTTDRIVRCNAHAGRASWIQESRPQALAAAMLRDEDLQPARIPFAGFYNSFLTAAFGEGIEHELEWRLEEADSVACSLTRDELEDCARDFIIDAVLAVGGPTIRARYESRWDPLEITASWGNCTVQIYQAAGESSYLKDQLSAFGEM